MVLVIGICYYIDERIKLDTVRGRFVYEEKFMYIDERYHDRLVRCL